MILRPYQSDAISAVWEHLQTRDDNPCVVMPTGSGKSPVIGAMVRDAVTLWGGRVLVLAHVKELLEQNADKIRRMAPEVEVGVYSAGLGRRDTRQSVIVAGVQSIYKRACELDRFDLVLIDEAHLIPESGDGMYRQFLAEAKVVNPNLRVVGLTATPYRLESGLICGPTNILNHVCYEAGIRSLIADGFLCPLTSKASRCKADLSDVGRRGGEFIAAEAESVMNADALVRAAVDEMIVATEDRRAVLIFATGIKHGAHIAAVLRERGLECGFVHGETPKGERAELLARFRGERGESLMPQPPLKYLCNVNVLTTGFDAPHIDCVVLLRPTESKGLFYQMCGRGFRLHPSKSNCLVLDFAGNILRHGPVDCLEAVEKSRRGGTGERAEGHPAKECPECREVVSNATMTCPACGYVWPTPPKHEAKPSTEGVLSGEITDTEYDVLDVQCYIHRKKGDPAAPPTLKVEYKVGFEQYVCEWICIEHGGFAGEKAAAWWSRRSDEPVPTRVTDALLLQDTLAPAVRITVRKVSGERFERIIKYRLGPKPQPKPIEEQQPHEILGVPADADESVIHAAFARRFAAGGDGDVLTRARDDMLSNVVPF